MSPFSHSDVLSVVDYMAGPRLVPPGEVGAAPAADGPRYRIRPAEAGDVGYIVHSWLESYHAGNALMRQVRFGRYKEPMRRSIHRLLGTSQVYVACDAADSSRLYGWACGELYGDTPVLHYVYVAQLFRGVGMARDLCNQLLRHWREERIEECTHLTFVGGKIAGRREVEYNPFRIKEAA